MKKGFVLLAVASCLTVVGTLAAVAAVKNNTARFNAVRAEPTLRTLVINEAPTVVDGVFSVQTTSGTTVKFKVSEGTFTPGGTFGTMASSTTIGLEYDKDDDILFPNLYSISISLKNVSSIYYGFYYVHPEKHVTYSLSQTGYAYNDTEILTSNNQVQIYNDNSGSSFHSGNPNFFEFYTAGISDVEVSSITIKYTC